MVTITEGLAEIKTIEKRIQKKREFVSAYLGRQEGLKDPLLHETGGSRGAIQRERQAISDLEERVVSIRRAIQSANVATVVEVESERRTVADWLVWRREIAAGRQSFIAALRNAIATTRREAQAKGYAIAASSDQAKAPTDVIINIDEQELAREAEKMETILGTLDGQLSLRNATVLIEV